MHGAQVGLAVLGTLLIGVSIASITGFVPLSIGPCVGPVTVVASFNYTVAGYNVTIVPHNQVPCLWQSGSVTSSATYYWGDGKSGTAPSHQYGVGSYTVSEVFSATGSPTQGGVPITVTVSASGALSIPSGATGSVSSSGPTNANIIPAFDYVASNLTVTVTDASVAMNQTIASIQWSFGDGTNGTGATTAHTYPAAGNYTIQESVTGGAITSSRNVPVYTVSKTAMVTAPAAGGAPNPSNGKTVVVAPFAATPAHGITSFSAAILSSGLALLVGAILPFGASRPGTVFVIGVVAGVVVYGLMIARIL